MSSFDSVVNSKFLATAAALDPTGYTAAGREAAQMFGKLFSMFRAGAREADQIVPVQNQVSELLEHINRRIEDPATSVTELRQLRDQLIVAGREFNAFTRDRRFTDGRAPRQARLTIFPLLDGTDGEGHAVSVDLWGNPVNGGTIGSIYRSIAQKGGGYSGATPPNDGGAGVLAAGLIGALLLKG